MKRSSLVVGFLVVAAAAGAVAVLSKSKGPENKLRTAKADRGDVVATVTASGSLSAVTTVKVGSQVSGIIARLHADFNDEVRRDQLLAELDPAPFQAAVDQRKADLEKARVELRNAETSLRRVRSLASQQLSPQSDLDTAQANRDAAAASVEQGEAALNQALTNLSYTKIRSPIAGVVVDRQYDVGQTVAASFQAPTLFTIAQDLTKMQVLTNIDEADIGRVLEGQEASFTVDAFPERPFSGRVAQIRLSPQTVQNVVTYPVLLDVSNPEGKLRPGMTANVQVPVETRKDALRVPNAALRFRPDPSLLPPAPKNGPADAVERKKADGAGSAEKRERPSGSERSGPPAGGRERRGGVPNGVGGREGATSRSGAGTGVVYLEGKEGKLVPVPVRTLLTDGNFTALEPREEGALKEGDEVVVGLATARAVDGSSPRGGSGGGGMGGGRRPF